MKITINILFDKSYQKPKIESLTPLGNLDMSTYPTVIHIKSVIIEITITNGTNTLKQIFNFSLCY